MNIVLLLAILGSIYLLITHPTNTEKDTERYSFEITSSSECGDAESAARVIDHYELVAIQECAMKTGFVNNIPVDYIEVIHGPASNCPSGCIYQETRALVEHNGDIYDFKAPTMVPAGSWAFQGDTSIPNHCFGFDIEEPINNDYAIEIEKRGDVYGRVFTFANFDTQAHRTTEYYDRFVAPHYPCLINGTVFSSDLHHHDLSEVEVLPQPPSECGNDATCISDRLRITGDLESCVQAFNAAKITVTTNGRGNIEQIGPNACYEIYAYMTGNPSWCENIDTTYTRDGFAPFNIETCIENVKKIR